MSKGHALGMLECSYSRQSLSQLVGSYILVFIVTEESSKNPNERESTDSRN